LSTAAGIIGGIVLAALAVAAFGPSALEALRRRRRRRGPEIPLRAYDPGRERRAERKARELLRSVVSAEEFEMYAELGFLAVEGSGAGSYAYLVYPHRPIVAYDRESGELLNEYCVVFPDGSPDAAGARLPDADDVLAKWMSLRGGERSVIATANMHVPGRQLDPDQVRRDLARLREWRATRKELVG
jgi:hypothetical protein